MSLLVPLRFTGGLNSSGSDGEYSLYTQFNQREIMFHVSTMLPTSNDPDNKQQVTLLSTLLRLSFVDNIPSYCRELKQRSSHSDHEQRDFISLTRC